MAESTLQSGQVVFGALIFITLVSAGVACLAPARDFRPLLGGLTIALNFLASLYVTKILGNWFANNGLVVLDFLTAVAFYALSRPSAGEATTKNDWAGIAAALYFMVFIATLLNVSSLSTHKPLEAIATISVISFFVICSAGLVRGFPIYVLAFFSVFSVGFAIIAQSFYVATLNILTLAAILTVMVASNAIGSRNLRRRIETLLR